LFLVVFPSFYFLFIWHQSLLLIVPPSGVIHLIKITIINFQVA